MIAEGWAAHAPALRRLGRRGASIDLNGSQPSMIRLLLAMLLTVSLTTNVAAQPKPRLNQARRRDALALYVTLAPAWFDPGRDVGGLPHAVLDPLTRCTTRS